MVLWEAFIKKGLAKDEKVYSDPININSLQHNIHFLPDLATCTHALVPVAIQAVQDDGSGGTIALVIEGSVDGANFTTLQTLIASLANDAAHDYASLVVDFYPFYRLSAEEDNTEACTGLCVWVAFG